ncbi:MAG: hypothetical protein ACD_28C00158G0002 [uncultured bacterium]|nr:MAG: hypothetical protein ACD_28C00158G0002 [uncultured bacterium]KKT73286.1 MAG: hypothetical protein UW70_C0087G0004 [Candidatus Peregrinibacteria bacterium GW2011_GWA2_44_7]
MSSSSLIQIKVDPSLKEKLKRIALSKGLNVTSYIKMSLIQFSEQEEHLALTENGFTQQEESRIYASIQAGEKLYKSGHLKMETAMAGALKTLEE